MILKKIGALLGLVVLGSVACNEVTPTGVDPNMLPDEPVTVEVRIPWSEFGSQLASYGGFGNTRDLGLGVVAHQVGDSLEAHTLVKLNRIPTSVTVRDSTGTSGSDTTLTVLGGRIAVAIDTLGSVKAGPVTLQAAMMGQAWDVATATWESAVDSILGSTTAWDVPGGGPVAHALTTVWDPAAGDTAFFELDSAGVATWADTTDANQGLLLSALSAGSRLKVLDAQIRVDVVPSSNPDTTVVVTATRAGMTFVYSPEPQAPDDGSVRVGGTPSWRSVLHVALPATLSGPSRLCAAAGCPLDLTAARVSYAALVLTSKQVPLAFMPSDSVNLDVRAVYDPTALPKAPLGSSLLTNSIGKRVSPTYFGADEGTEVEIPITPFVRTILAPDTTQSVAPPSTLALLSTYEPVSLAYASFFGPGSLHEPVLKLIVTVSHAVELP